MNCYVCHQKGDTTPAVAICVLCGMALCSDHLIREELPVWKDVHAGMGASRRKLPEAMPRIVCAACHSALHQD
ncbi:MAG: DUF2180 family protein [Armatimonadetes bacterium]|nr:DUF2180 family protein [Armatimonadota bacterium]